MFDSSRLSLLMLLSTGVASAGETVPPTEAVGAFKVVAPDEMPWTTQPGSIGVKEALIAGDPSKPGTYVVRVTFPPRVMDRPHWHSGDRHITVIKGTWYMGTGDQFDPSKAVPLSAGSYVFHPARGVHWDGSNGDEEVIVQIIGIGPVETASVNPEVPFFVKLDD